VCPLCGYRSVRPLIFFNSVLWDAAIFSVARHSPSFIFSEVLPPGRAGENIRESSLGENHLRIVRHKL